MIDEKRLDELAEAAFIDGWNFADGDGEQEELIRLARLGLWAENHAIRALKNNATVDPWDKGGGPGPEAMREAKAALAALPKEGK